MRLRSLVRRLRSPSQSVSRAPVQPNIDHPSRHPPSAASVLEGTDVDQIGVDADRRRCGIVEADAHLREPCCRSDFYSPQQHAAQLLAHLILQENSAGEILPSETLQIDYGSMAFQLRWHCRAWNPVAREFTRLTGGRKLYRRRTEPPVGGRERVYAIPTAAAAKPICEHVLGRASLFVPEEDREFLWPGPPTAEHCPRVGATCPLWRPWHGARR